MASLGTVSLNVAANTASATSGLDRLIGVVERLAENVDRMTQSFSTNSTHLQQYGTKASEAAEGAKKLEDSTSSLDGKKKGLLGSLRAMPPQLQAVVAGVAAGAAAFTAISATVVKFTSDARKLADELDKASIKTGTSAEQLQRYRYAADQSGVSVSRLERSLVRSKRPLEDVAEEVKNAATYQEQLTIAQREYGQRGASEMLPLLLAGKEGIKEMGDELQALGGVMSNEAVAAGTQLNDALTRINTMFTGLKNTIGSVFLPAATEVANIAVAIGQKFMGLLPPTQGLSKTITNLVRQGIVNFLKGVQSMIDRIIGLIEILQPAHKALGFVGKVVSVVVQAFNSMGTAIRVLLKIIAGFVVKGVGGLVKGLSSLIDMLSKAAAAIPGMKGISESIKELGEAAEGVSKMMDNLGDSIHDSAYEETKKLEEQAKKLQETLGEDYGDKFLNLLEKARSGSVKAREELDKLISTIEDGDFAADLTATVDGATGAGDPEDSDSASSLQEEIEQLEEKKELTEGEIALLNARLALLQEEDEYERGLYELAVLSLQLEEDLRLLEEEGLEGLELEVEQEELIYQHKLAQQKVQERLNELRKEENDGLTDFQRKMKKIGEDTQKYADGLNAASDILGGINAETEEQQRILKGVQGAIKVATGLQAVFNAVAAANPLGAIAAAVGVIIGGISALTSAMSSSTKKDEAKEQEENDRLAKTIAKEIADEQEKRFGPTLTVNIDSRGALIGDEMEVGRKLTDLVSDELQNRSASFVLGGG